ncbi:hypothetical protein Bhyg_09602 [Pseudolycoriella hygida]|uniref:Uncharacterized protein n=1 Tax=Pseudolycoriella hygida TaxID=35572 RepID=A0A9Q0N6T3_9DIPT|nr:hypothetical protein Bhyg_09602 [Pseudolycoriella hygida]
MILFLCFQIEDAMLMFDKQTNRHRANMAPVTRKNAQSALNTSVYKSDDKVYSLLKTLNLKIDKNHKRVGQQIDDLCINHRDEVRKHLQEIESKMDDKIQKRLSFNASEMDRLASVVENNERLSKLNDVILKGIPNNRNEKLMDVFDRVSSVIGFETTSNSVNTILRLKSGNNQTSSPILVKFLSANSKQDFMMKYYAHRDLKLSAIGLDSEDRIYATHNLTKHNFELQLKAVQMLKEKKIVKIQIRAGLVYVKFNGTDDFKKLVHSSDLINDVVTAVE